MIYLYKGNNSNLIEKIKDAPNIVFLDPPYNTKSKDLSYSDNFGESNNWYNYFKEKLDKVKKIIQVNCAIFLTIGSEELANAINAINSTFGEKSIKIIMPRLTKKVSKTTNFISKNHDFLIIATTGKVSFNRIGINKQNYNIIDQFLCERGKYQLRRLDYCNLKYSYSMDYEIELNNQKFVPGKNINSFQSRKDQTNNNNRKDWCWIWSKEFVKFAIDNEFIVQKNGNLYKKTYTKCKIIKVNKKYSIEYYIRNMPFDSLELTNNLYTSSKGKSKLEKIFTYSKSYELLKFIINLPIFKNKIILDPYAGSGLTGIIASELECDAHLIQIDEKLKNLSKEYLDKYETIYDLTKDILTKKGVDFIEK